ncbi:polysaccharide deacetylase family protein [Pontibacter cellulosilyticus]|uniref:Polysaccharide deacetylase family protein n=1 Tax=Pontibacter cellulosilyticus TaxID=1720253 RepID=A0A923N4M9_9BACT|nr:polysaccharide deacetylase family protein [Pontibacter cellulosilyticus]MBC5992151.1 polysaccharide deacetylase family protein [Pontibacter cellulosilyticus]
MARSHKIALYQLNYILQHFHLLHPNAKELSIHYDTAEDILHKCKVSISKYAGGFFEQKRPRPQQVVWRAWKGQQIPFFFDAENEQELVTYHSNGTASINYDIISSAFYLLSGWQEYYGPERDKFRRYTYKASMQAKYGFITKPVVNYYFDILKEVLERVHQVDLSYSLWGQQPFATCLTSDIDRLHSAWRAAGKQAFKATEFKSVAALLARKAVGKDAWDNLAEVTSVAEKYGAKTTMFFLPSNQFYNGYPNADYDVTKPRYQKLISALAESGHEIALHGSFGTSNDLVQLKADQRKLPVQVKGNRFHYLCYQPENTEQVLQQSKLEYDTSLGFSEHFGFRNSFCHPFYPFDFNTHKAANFLELPLILMDTTLYSINYMSLKSGEAMAAVSPVIEEVIKFGGLFTILWHNENFSSYSEFPVAKGSPTWRQVLEQILTKVKSESTDFLTCAEAAAKIKGSED